MRLRSKKGTFSQQPPSVVWLAPGDGLIVVLAHERGTLSFLLGSSRAAAPGAVPPWAAGASSSGGSLVRVADCRPEELPDLPQAYNGVGLLVLAAAPLATIRPETCQAVTRWVRNGGTLVVAGGADWAGLRDPFLKELLLVAVHGAAEAAALTALATLHGTGMPAPGPVVIPQATPKLGAAVHLRQGELPARGYLFINSVDEHALVGIADDLSQASTTDRSRRDPITRHLDLSGVRIASARRALLKLWGRALAEADGSPVIAAGERGGVRSIWVGWDLLASDFPLRVAFPIFLANYVDWLAPAATSAPPSRRRCRWTW